MKRNGDRRDLLRQWSELEAEWERRVNLVVLTADRAKEVTAVWVYYNAAGGRLETDGEDSTCSSLWTFPPNGRLPAWEAAQILTAARKETQPSRRWAHWIMAFAGMRVGQVLQLSAADVQQDNGIRICDLRRRR